MDRLLARRLSSDPSFKAKIVKLAKDYLKIGRDSLAYWSSDFDMAYDIMSCYSPLTKKDMEAIERGHPKRYILPMTATQITTMTTYVAQVLFGQETPWKVEGRRPEDDVPAEFVNNLLRWNAEQQPTYALGYLWCQDAIAVNRGIFYDSWAPIFKPEMTMVNVVDPQDINNETGQPNTYARPMRRNKVVGSYCRMEIVSPYDFVCDPALPLWRLQEMRFAGHRFVIPVTELRRRSKLPVDHPSYVLPAAIVELVEKAKKGIAQADSAVPSLPGVLPNPAEIRLSRTAYERTRALQPTGNVQADKNDTGNVEAWELWVKLVPSDNEIYSGDGPGNLSPTMPDGALNPATNLTSQLGGLGAQGQGLPQGNSGGSGFNGENLNGDNGSQYEFHNDEPVIFQILICGGDVLLSMVESTYAHGSYPYAVGEGRPNAHFQFSPGWVQILKGIQDYVDWLKNRHQEALSRTIGNIFVYDPACVDVTDFMNPDKEGLLISLKPEAAGKKISDVFEQVPIKDMTENFLEEAMEFVKFSESVTAASPGMQGSIPGGADPSATQFAGTQQMGAGRMTSIARLLSSLALVPQGKRFVSNFQQFLDNNQEVRFKPTNLLNVPPELRDAASVSLSKDTIAGEYDFISHDGTLPGTDGRKVSAIATLLEASQGFPQMFVPGPGNIDPRKLLLDGAKASGLKIENYTYPANTPAPGAPPGAPAGPGQPPSPSGQPSPLTPPALPPVGAQPPAGTQRPGPSPTVPRLPDISAPDLKRVAAPQPKPSNQ